MNPNPPQASGEVLMEMSGVAIARTHLEQSALLENVNWQVKAGDFWVVGALHRAGKSALLATAAGLQPPKSGVLSLFGSDIAQLEEDNFLELRLRTGLIFERGGCLFSQLTLAENIALPLCYHRNFTVYEAEERVRLLLESIGLIDLAHRRAALLSRDHSQRAALARALVLKPEILFVDNPFSGLDPRERFWWHHILSELSRGHAVLDGKPLTLVITADDLLPWVEHARRFACINQRQFVALGGRDALQQSKEPLIRELLAAGVFEG